MAVLTRTWPLPAHPGATARHALHWLHHASPAQLFFLAYGFLPIGCLSLALQDLIPLHRSAEVVLLPATAAALTVGGLRARWGCDALFGLLSGIVAVAMYDLVRGAFVVAHAMPDPIPNIGRMALANPEAHWLWGYAWRFIWNGGAMGIAFAMLPFRGVRAGAGFGLFVCGCLFVTLAVSPIAQERFLHLTAPNIAIALVGHLVYGAVLGWTLDRARPNRPVDLS